MNKIERLALITKLMEDHEDKTTMAFSELSSTATDVEDTVVGNEAFTEHQRSNNEILTSDEK